jgi:hypothetical protein
MKTFFAVLLACLLAFIGSAAAELQLATTQKTMIVAVTNIDPVNNTIQGKDSTGIIQTVALTPDVQMIKNGVSATINDIRVGDIVTVKVSAEHASLD